MILFCFISLLGTASAEEIIDDNIASNDASMDIDVIESPIHEGISISTVENSDVSADDSSSINGSASKGKLTANKLSADHTFTGSTFEQLQSFLNSGNINDGDTVYLGGIDLTSSWASYQHNFIDVNINNLKIMGGTSSNPNAFSTLNGNGACIFRLSGSGITLNNINFVNAGHNGDKGSAVNVQNSGCTINNCTFTNCKSTGGALYSSSAASNLKVNDCNFTNNVADWSNSGGAMYLDGPNTEISNCNFDSNSGGSYAGIFSDGDLKVTNSNFTNNGPGVIYSGSDIEIANSNFVGTTGNSVAVISGGSTNVENSNFTNNAGGAIYSSIDTEITNSNFVNNNGGTFNNVNVGAVYSGGTTTVRSSKFERNSAPNNNYGGINSRGVTTVTDSNFTENSGGAIHSYSNAEITGCIIENHNSTNSAVDVYGTATVTDSNFTNNTKTGYSHGGALNAIGDNSQISNSNFENNNAGSGGAIYIAGESSKIENCNFTANKGTTDYSDAGAIEIIGINAEVTDSNFINNSANSGGAIYDGASGLKLTDCNFTENIATYGGAINIYADDATLTNCNFTDNDASQQGGAIYIGADCYNADMTECNFTGNAATTGTAIYAADGANGKVTDCEFGVKPELNVNNGYPVLTLTLESDYAGIIVGNIEGGPSGGSTVPEANKTITLEIFDSEGTLVDTVTNITDDNGQMKYDYSHLPRGNYTYKATYMDGQTKEGPLNMGVVEGDNFSAIQAAINAAEPGSVIFLEGKTYYNDIRGDMAINKPITIIGTDGTVLDAENISRIFTIANNIDNVNLNNITFVNGFVEDGDGGAIYVSQGSDNLNLVNCNFTNNHATGEDSQGGALFIAGGANNGNIINSTFDNNTADIDGGAIINDGGWGWNIYNTSFTNNSAVVDGNSSDIHWGGGAIWTCNAPMNIYNSNFTENNGTYGGAIRGAVSTYDCLFDNNTATNGNGGAIDVTTDAGLYGQIDLEFVNTVFVNNDAKGNRDQDRAQGGGIHIYQLKEIEMYYCYCENNTADRGGAIDFYKLEQTIVGNCTIINNNASSEGGGMAIFCNRSIFEDANVSNNNAGTDGGAIWVIGNDALFNNITSLNNTAERGGSSYVEGQNTVIVNCNITNNTAVYNPAKPDDSGLGGAIDVKGDNCRIINLTSEDNNAYRGGSTFIRGDNTLVYNSTFDNNNATLRGGGLNIAGDGCIVENVTANNNIAGENGGGIYVIANGTQFKNITADNNQAERGGGAFIEGNDVTIDIGDFSNNKAIFNESKPDESGLGGALDIKGNGCNVSNVNSTGNTAYRGGSTFIRGNDTHVENCKLDDNNATLRGGGLNIAGDRCTIDNVEINNNNAGTMGGGIYVVSNGTNFTNIIADNNKAERGGAAFINGTDILVQHGELNNNLAIFNESKENESGLGGGFDIVGDNVLVDDVHSNNNQAYRGGSTFIRGENVTVQNCNLDNNNATVRGGALNIGGGDNCKVINVSVSNNHAGEDGGAIYVIGNYSLFDNVNSTNNTAERGGSSFVAGDYINVTNCNLNNNNATIRGGGLDVAGSNCIFENVSLSNCNANGTDYFDGGGGLYVVGNDNRFTNITSENNTAIHYGGSIYVGGNNTLIENSTIHNSTAWNGGGITIAGDNSKFFNNNITENHAVATLNDTFHNVYMQGGGVLIAGGGTNFTNNNISSNSAVDNGGGVAVFFGQDTYFENIYAENNTADNGGFATLTFANNMTVVNSTFYNNHATGDIDWNKGEGGAFHLSYASDIDIQGNFTHNTAVNGSAIYLNESSLKIHDSDFFDNQAHTYYLLIIPEENTTYNKGEDVVINITHIGGDNIANAIYNAHGEPGNENIKIKNITYPFYNNGILENKTISPDGYVSPVDGYENSDNGNLIYLDDSEDNQVIYYNITNKDTDDSILVGFNRTEISGTVTITLKDLPVGNYSVKAHYPETTYYTEIANETVFRVVNNDNPELNITKVANDQIVYVGNQTSFTIVVNNTGNHNLSEVVVTDKDFSQGLVYDHYTNGSKQWDYIGNNQWRLVGDLNVNETANFTVFFNVTLNGTLTNNVSVVSNETNQTNATNYTTAYKPNMTVDKIANDKFVYVGNQTSFTIVVTNSGDCNLTDIIVTDTDFTKPGLVYDHYTNSSRQWTYDGAGHWTLVNGLENGTSANFTVFFNVTTNGTLVNNVSAVSNLTNETNATNQTRAYQPNMTVQKIANDEFVYVGNQTSFTIVVTNTGDCNLTDIIVTDTDFTKPGLVYDHYTNSSREWTYDGAGHWTLVNGLENGTSANFTVFFNVTVNGTLVNNVSAVSNLTNETNATNQTRAYQPNMTVQKIANDKVVYVGNTTSFTIVVTNTGDCNLSDVVVTDTDFTKPGLVYDHYTNSSREWTYDGAGHWTLVNGLENGTSANFTVYFNVTTNGTLVNNVSAVSNLTNETNGTNNTTAYRPNMTVQKIANDEVVYVGNITSFDIVVTNTGDCNLTGIVVTDKDFSSGLRYKDYTNGTRQWTYDESAKTWTLVGLLENGSSASFTIVFDVIDNGTLVNNVSAVSNLTNETNGTNNTTAYRPNMTVQKIANDKVVYVGNITSFDIVVTNTGDCNLSGIVVTDKDFSSGLRYKDYTNGTRQWTFDESANTWTLVGSLENGTSASFTVIFDVIDNGTLVNNVSAGSNLTNETNDTNNTTAKPVCDVIIYKEVNATECLVGDLVEWTITVENVGPSTALDVIVKDVLSKDLELVSASSSDYNNATGEWNIGDLKVNATVSLSLVTRVLASGTIYNNATVNTTTDESNYTNNNASNKTDAKVLCDLVITKAVNQSSCNVSDIIEWNITVTNLGPHSASDVIVKDLLPEGLELISYKVSIGNFNEVISEWSVGTLDKD